MLKALMEKRAALIAEMETIVAGLSETKDGKTEIRSMNDEEQAAYDAKKAEIVRIDATIGRVKEERAMDINEPAENEEPQTEQQDAEEAETRAFESFLRRGVGLETRADANWTESENAAVIPTSIANKIIAKVVEISPIFARATRYNVKGTLNIPYYDRTTGTVQMDYADEFTTGKSTSGKIKTISLGGYLARAKSLVSKKLINNSAFDIVNYAINIMAQEIALWVDGQLINGTPGKIDGLSTAKQVVMAESAVAVKADELINLQDAVPDMYQNEAIWVMNRATRSAIRKLKDGDGTYLLQKDATSKWGYSLFGKPVYVADKIAGMASGNISIMYGDFSGLAVKISEDIAIDVLREAYAEQHAVCLLAWTEMDAKIENDEKIAVLKHA